MWQARRPLTWLALAAVTAAGGGAGAGAASGGAADAGPAQALAAAAARAMGGIELLRSLGVVHAQGLEIVDELASHDRAGMPLQTRVFQYAEWRDAGGGRRRYEAAEIGTASSFKTAVVMNGDVAMRTFNGESGSDFVQVLWGYPALQQSQEALALAPEQAVLDALAAGEARVLPGTVVDGRPLDAIALRRQGAEERLYLDRQTHLPAAVEITRELPYESFYGELGALTTRIQFASWWSIGGGLRYPREWTVYFRGQLQRVAILNQMELRVAPAADLFAIPDETARAFRNRTIKSIEDYPLGWPPGAGPTPRAAEVVPGVVFIPGWMNVVLVKQDDGLVVVEAPISSGYSARVIADAERRFPGSRVKAVVSTSDAPVHFGGVREYAARGTPIYVRDANLESLAALLSAPHAILLDAYARAPRPPDLRAVSSPVTLGSGANQLVIHPVHSAGGERSLMVYLPRHRLLYTADMPVTDRGRPFRFHSFTIADAVAQAHLEVDRVLGIHAAPTPWQDVESTHPR